MPDGDPETRDRTGWGGRREGAGRDPKYPEGRMSVVAITLPASYITGIAEYGRGEDGEPNLSAGVRRLWEERER